VTDLEVTTGALDSTATPPGYLTEVHVRAFRPDGKRQFEKEFELLRSGGGYAKFSFPLPVPTKRRGDDDADDGDNDDSGKRDTRLQRGQLLKLQVNGRGVPGGEDEGRRPRRGCKTSSSTGLTSR
jgi:hypothetical protein